MIEVEAYLTIEKNTGKRPDAQPATVKKASVRKPTLAPNQIAVRVVIRLEPDAFEQGVSAILTVPNRDLIVAVETQTEETDV